MVRRSASLFLSGRKKLTDEEIEELKQESYDQISDSEGM